MFSKPNFKSVSVTSLPSYSVWAQVFSTNCWGWGFSVLLKGTVLMEQEYDLNYYYCRSPVTSVSAAQTLKRLVHPEMQMLPSFTELMSYWASMIFSFSDSLKTDINIQAIAFKKSEWWAFLGKLWKGINKYDWWKRK